MGRERHHSSGLAPDRSVRFSTRVHVRRRTLSHTCVQAQTYMEVQTDVSLTKAHVFLILCRWKERKPKWNKALILNLATSHSCTGLHLCYANTVIWFFVLYAVAGKHFSQTLCSIGLKATGGFLHSAWQWLSDTWHRSITFSVFDVYKGETLTLLFSPAPA